MLDVSVAHLEQKLFQSEILQFLNLAYFLHIKAKSTIFPDEMPLDD